MMRKSWLLLLFLAPAGCDGPREEAGERIDASNGETGGTSSIVSGPAEKKGEALDRAARSGESSEGKEKDRP